MTGDPFADPNLELRGWLGLLFAVVLPLFLVLA